jgi:hypothetical protein
MTARALGYSCAASLVLWLILGALVALIADAALNPDDYGLPPTPMETRQ